jgi:septal ring factor EnvC (AmiA/AmiB activator)
MEWVKAALEKCQAEVKAVKAKCRDSDAEYNRVKEIARTNDNRLSELESLLTWLEQVDRNEPAVEVPL